MPATVEGSGGPVKTVEDPASDRVRRRSWVLIVGAVLLLALAIWSGVQARRSTERERQLHAELRQVYQEAENLRMVAIQWRDRAMLFEQQIAAANTERDRLRRRLKEMEAELAELKARRGSRSAARP